MTNLLNTAVLICCTFTLCAQPKLTLWELKGSPDNHHDHEVILIPCESTFYLKASQTQNQVTSTWSIKNEGNELLILSLPLGLEGDVDHFGILSQPSQSQLLPGEEVHFDVQYVKTNHTDGATLKVLSNDVANPTCQILLDGGSINDPCPEGTYGPGDPDCTNCPMGSTSPEGSTNIDQCFCDENYYGEVETTCMPCPANSTSPANADEIDECVCDPGYARINDECVACSPGFFENNDVCEECPAGRFQDLSAQTSCKFCPIGTAQSALGSNSCQPCLEGEYQDQTGQITCKTCPANSTSSQGSTNINDCVCDPGYERVGDMCIACLVGEFEDNGTCMDCPINTYQDNPGENSCIPCPANSTSQAGSDDIGDCVCADGYERINDTCEACGPGFFEMNDSCEPCTEGKFQDLEGQTSCKDCPEGFFQDITGQSSCKPCAANTYQDIPGSIDCKPCQENASSPEGSNMPSDCVCNEGYMLEANACVCESDTDGDGVCDPFDQCPGFDDTEDMDNDDIPDGCDQCPNDDTNACNLDILDENRDGNGLSLDDPCNCFDPLNEVSSPVGYLFHDILSVSTGANLMIRLTSTNDEFRDSLGNAIPLNTILGTTDMNGDLLFDFYHLGGVAAIIMTSNGQVTEPFTSSICDSSICPGPVPTLSEWGLIVLCLIMMIVGIIFLKSSAYHTILSGSGTSHKRLDG